VQKKLCRKMWKARKVKFKARCKRAMKIFLKCSGGSPSEGLILLGPLQRIVRIDYVKNAVALLCRDVAQRKTLSYRNQPVNVQKWIEALCYYEVAQFTPRRWVQPQSYARPPVDEFAHLNVLNDQKVQSVFMDVVKNCLKNKGVPCREYDNLNDYQTSLSYFHTTRSLGLGVRNIGNMTLEVKGCHRALPSSTPLQDVWLTPRPNDLSSQEILGTLARAKTRSKKVALVAVGCGARVFALFHHEKKKIYNNRCALWLRIQEAVTKDETLHQPVWTMRVTWAPANTEQDHADAHTKGAALQLAYSREITQETTRFVHLLGVTEQFGEAVSEVLVKSVKNLVELSKVKKAPPLTASRDNLLQHILAGQSFRSYGTEPRNAACAPVVQKLPAQRRVARVITPLQYRNAWICEDGEEISVTDPVLRASTQKRRRFTLAPRCPKCPPVQGDARKGEEAECANLKCKGKFLFHSTLTHYGYKNADGRPVEEDMNLPLFTDEVLAELWPYY